jgi:hypothetical protein
MNRVKNVKYNILHFGLKKITGVAIVLGKNNPKACGKYSVGNYN